MSASEIRIYKRAENRYGWTCDICGTFDMDLFDTEPMTERQALRQADAHYFANHDLTANPRLRVGRPT